MEFDKNTCLQQYTELLPVNISTNSEEQKENAVVLQHDFEAYESSSSVSRISDSYIEEDDPRDSDYDVGKEDKFKSSDMSENGENSQSPNCSVGSSKCRTIIIPPVISKPEELPVSDKLHVSSFRLYLQ